MNAKETLGMMVEIFSEYLDELYPLKDDPFASGEITAYTECLELISDCDDIGKEIVNKILNKNK